MSVLETALSNALVALPLALLAATVGLVCRRPAAVHALWLLVLIKLVTPPLFRVSIPWPALPATESRTEQTSAPAPDFPLDEEIALPNLAEEPLAALPSGPADPLPEGVEIEDVAIPEDGEPESAPQPDPEPDLAVWQFWLGCLWVGGSACWFLLAGWRVLRFSRALRYARPAPEPLRLRLERLAGQVGLTSCPPVFLIPGRVAPMVWALGSPVVLVPEGLEERIGPEGFDTLLVHELAHIRRRDHQVRWLEFLALGLYWWHPVVWFARRELREAEEQCCDAWVVRTLPGSGRTYATALVDALDYLCETPGSMPLLASGLGPVADLKRRLTMIMRGRTPHALGRTAGLAVLALAVLLLPLVPGFGQAQEPEKDPVRVRFAQAGQGPAENLKQLEEELRRKHEEIEAIKRRLEERRRAAVEKEKAKVKDKPNYRAAEAGPTIRIEISGVGLKAEDLKALAEKLREALPAGKDKRIVIALGGGDTPRTHVAPLARAGKRVEVEVRPPQPGQPGLPGMPGMAPRPHTPPPGQGGGDPRIQGLEKKLDAVLRELEALRREMRSRPGGPGGAPRPGGTGGGGGGGRGFGGGSGAPGGSGTGSSSGGSNNGTGTGSSGGPPPGQSTPIGR